MRKKGFTIIELLTVIAVITLLLGLLVPSVSKVKRVAKDLAQKSQLRAIDIGLEMWMHDNDGEYPESNVEYDALGNTTGAHKLVEALVGRDLHGFDSNYSTWDAGNDESVGNAYATTNYNYRDNTYLDVDRVNTFQMAQIYDSSVLTNIYPGNYNRSGNLTTVNMPAPVFTDMYKRVRISTPDNRNIKIGSPILYFKAQNTDIFTNTMVDSSVFNYRDNYDIFRIGRIDDQEAHPYDYSLTGGIGSPEFYDDLINPTIPAGIDPVPYRQDSYVLLSAGEDGLYGTVDDIWNIHDKK